MAKVTSKLQVTIPKAIADQYGIQPGDEIDWVAAGEAIRIVPAKTQPASGDLAAKLKRFDEGTRRQRQREAGKRRAKPAQNRKDRGWKREDLYTRGSTR